jgi:hypothetical protein
MPITSLLWRIILLAVGKPGGTLMPKMLINAQKEQICRSHGLLGYGEIMVKWLESLQNVINSSQL